MEYRGGRPKTLKTLWKPGKSSLISGQAGFLKKFRKFSPGKQSGEDADGVPLGGKRVKVPDREGAKHLESIKNRTSKAA